VGPGLSSNVKINGLERNSSSYSTADLLLVGQVGSTITNGIVRDSNQNQWALPATVTIPSGGEITVTATCTTIGAITADAGTITTIGTPTQGWQTVTNPSAATPGAAVENDAQLRVRQSNSTALPAMTILEGIGASVGNISGVARYMPYQNDQDVADSNGIPAHSIAIVVDGGDAVQIAEAIALKKGPGPSTYGTTSETVTDAFGFPMPINFFRPTVQAITGTVALKALGGYDTTVGTAIQQAIADYVNATLIGGGPSNSVEWDGAITAAKSITQAATFKITGLTLSGPAGAGAPDVPLAFNQAASCDPNSIVLTVT
jgi:uncharacterized phage protein gp47/JayE